MTKVRTYHDGLETVIDEDDFAAALAAHGGGGSEGWPASRICLQGDTGAPDMAALPNDTGNNIPWLPIPDLLEGTDLTYVQDDSHANYWVTLLTSGVYEVTTNASIMVPVGVGPVEFSLWIQAGLSTPGFTAFTAQLPPLVVVPADALDVHIPSLSFTMPPTPMLADDYLGLVVKVHLHSEPMAPTPISLVAANMTVTRIA